MFERMLKYFEQSPMTERRGCKKFFERVGGPLKLQFANHFIIYQKCPLKGRIVLDRLHSELCAWGVKSPSAFKNLNKVHVL